MDLFEEFIIQVLVTLSSSLIIFLINKLSNPAKTFFKKNVHRIVTIILFQVAVFVYFLKQLLKCDFNFTFIVYFIFLSISIYGVFSASFSIFLNYSEFFKCNKN